MLHGSNGRKEKYIERAYEFVRNGFFVTLFDAYGYGELKQYKPKLQMENLNLSTVNCLLLGYSETSKYINIIADSYQNNDSVDAERIALIGVSMGAHTIYYNILKERNPKIKVAVAINGSPSWRNFVRSYISHTSNMTITLSEKDITIIEEYIKTLEPLSFLQNLENLPLLMLNGKEDEIVRIEIIGNSYIHLRDNNKDNLKIKFIEYDEVGHTVTQQMLKESLEWIKKYI